MLILLRPVLVRKGWVAARGHYAQKHELVLGGMGGSSTISLVFKAVQVQTTSRLLEHQRQETCCIMSFAGQKKIAFTVY